MAEAATKMPVRNEGKPADRPAEWRPFESLRREVDRLFEDFQLGSWRLPFGGGLFDVQPLWRGEIGKAPAVDIVDTDKAYEITAELPTVTLTKTSQAQKSEKKIAIKAA
jgi:HSP20 family protein